MKVGDVIVMPAGTRVGMGRLRKPTTSKIETVETATDGTLFYRVWWIDDKGKRRTTYYSPTHG